MRRGELLNLTWANVELEAGHVKVEPKKAGTFTLRGEQYPILEWTAKDYENRTIPIPEATVSLLRRLKAKSGGSAYLFLSLDRLRAIARFMAKHGGKLSDNYELVNNAIRDFHQIQTDARRHLAKESDRDDYEWEQRSIHDLRRTFGSMMAQHLPIHELKKLLGHSSVRTTESYYLAPSENLADKVRSVFAAAASA